jgi:hypothetical protein
MHGIGQIFPRIARLRTHSEPPAGLMTRRRRKDFFTQSAWILLKNSGDCGGRALQKEAVARSKLKNAVR